MFFPHGWITTRQKVRMGAYVCSVLNLVRVTAVRRDLDTATNYQVAA